MLFEDFKGLDIISQFIIIVVGVLGLVVVTLNLVCVIKTLKQRSFCIVSTGGNVMVLSLLGSNCVVGLTAFAKEMTFVFVGRRSPSFWSHFKNYITIFCLISSSFHILCILVIYLINTFRTFPRAVKMYGKFADGVTISLIWIASFAPSAIRSNDAQYPSFLTAISVLLVTCICCLTPMAFCVLKFHQKTGDKSSSEQFNVKSNLLKNRWLQYRQKEKVISLFLLASYLLCSVPYMIYYPVLSRVHDGKYTPDLIDDILFLFILGKCICDAIIFMVKKGWKRDQKKVNFRLKNEETSCPPANV